jgi:hypothetical protein
MKTKNSGILFSLMMLIPLLPLCQEEQAVKAPEYVTVGFEGGINFSNWGNEAGDFAADFSSELNYSGFSSTNLDNKHRFGISIGMYADVPFTANLSLQPELVYQNKGTSFKGSGYYQGIDMDLKFNIVANYLSLPVLINIHNKRTEYGDFVYFLTGPSVNLCTKSAMKVTVSAFGESETEEEKYDGIKTLDTNWLLAIGYDFYDARIEIRYEKGLTNISKPDYADYDFKNNTITLSLGATIH